MEGPLRPLDAHQIDQTPQSTAADENLRECTRCGTKLNLEARRTSKYCSPACRYKNTQNARSALRHLSAYLKSATGQNAVIDVWDPDLSALLGRFLECLPTQTTARHEYISKELVELDSLLLTEGPIAASFRLSVRRRAAVIALALTLTKSSTTTDRLLLIHAREVLRDVGVDGKFSAANYHSLLAHGEAAVRFFKDIKAYADLGRSLIALGNIYRLAGKRRAAQKFTWASHVLEELCDANDIRVARLLHQVTMWRLRCMGHDMNPTNAKGEVTRLRRLAEQIDDPLVWVEHYREEAGFGSYLFHDAELGFDRLRKLTNARRELTNHTSYADPTLLTPRIELLLEKGRTEEAVDFIRRVYVPQYLRNRHVYYYRKLSEWEKKCRFEFAQPLPLPEYASAFLSYLPRS
jgi:hypothetical protein